MRKYRTFTAILMDLLVLCELDFVRKGTIMNKLEVNNKTLKLLINEALKYELIEEKEQKSYGKMRSFYKTTKHGRTLADPWKIFSTTYFKITKKELII